MADDSELETLLVLCCLVAAVVFLCFSVGTVNLASQIAEAPAVEGALDLSELASEVERLTLEVEQLRREIATRREAVREPAPEELARRADRQRDVSALETELARLLERIAGAEADLARRRQRATDATKAGTSESSNLRQILDDLENQIEARRKAIAAIPVAVDPAFDDNLVQLQKRREALDMEMRELERQAIGLRDDPGTFSVRKNLTGSTTMARPFVVECRSKSVVFHPEGREVLLSDLPNKNPFQSLPAGTDGLVFLIRPDGFAAFHQTYGLASKSGMTIIYEAIDAHLSLRF